MINVQLNTRGASVLTALNLNTTVAITGNLSVQGDFSNPSDARIKKDITPLTPQLHLIRELSACTYLKTTTDKQEIGFIAQEVEKVFPSLVVTRKVGEIDDFREITYIHFIPILVKAIQELDAIVRTQAEQIEKLMGQNNAS